MTFFLHQRVNIIGAGISGHIIGLTVSENGESRYVIKQDNGLSAVCAKEDLEAADDQEKQIGL